MSPGDATSRSAQGRSAPAWTLTGKSLGEKPLDLPGPGAYNLAPQQQHRPSSPCYGFGTSSREPGLNRQVPGPGQYSPANLKKDCSSKYSFGSSERGKAAGANSAALTPGPAAYISPTCIGTEGPRFTAAPKRDMTRTYGRPDNTPGPGTYQTVGQGGPRGVSPKWGFGTSARICGLSDATPGPGAYDVAADNRSMASFPRDAQPMPLRSRRESFALRRRGELQGPSEEIPIDDEMSYEPAKFEEKHLVKLVDSNQTHFSSTDAVEQRDVVEQSYAGEYAPQEVTKELTTEIH